MRTRAIPFDADQFCIGKISEDMSRLLINGVLIMHARDVMVSTVITVGTIATVRNVATVLLENRISGVPVVDDAGKVVGIGTESDLMHRNWAE
jgi:CBS domain-containing protein